MNKEEVNDRLDEIIESLLDQDNIGGALVSVKYEDPEDEENKVFMLNDTTRDHELMTAKILSDLPEAEERLGEEKEDETEIDLTKEEEETHKYIG